MKSEVGFGIVGTGMIAAVHANAIQGLRNATLTGVYDLHPEKARRFAEDHHCRAFDTFESFLACPEIQAVTIATPSGMHADAAIPSARAGKHILCEKPLEVTLERTDAIIRTCRENGVFLSPVFQSRFSEPVRMVREAIVKGRFGRMLLASTRMRWYRDDSYYGNSGWRGTWKMDGGGALMNQAIHMVDLLLYLNGPAAEVSAFAGTLTHAIEVEDNLCAAVRYRNGSFGTIEVSTSCKPGFPRVLELSGSDGSAVIEEDRIARWTFSEIQPDDEEIRRSIPGTSPDAAGGSHPANIPFAAHAKQIGELADAILQNRPPNPDGLEGRRAVELIRGIYESVRTGKTIRFES